MSEKINIESQSGKVCCLFNHIKDSSSVVILGHGYLSDKESRTNAELSRRLNEAGISTISFDMYGHGESEGDAECLTVTKALQNVLAVYDFARSRGFQKIGMAGSSFTGIVSMIAATERDFDVISLKCPVFDSKTLWDVRLGKSGVERWRKEGYISPFGKKWRFEAYEDASGYDMEELVKKIRAPLLVVHGDKDVTVPIEHAKSIIYLASGEKKLVVVEDADHFFRDPALFEKMIEESFLWLSTHLA